MKCDYCHIRYDIIGRLENLEDELEYIAAVNNFTSDLHSVKDNLHMHVSGTKPLEIPKKHLIKKNGMIDKIKKVKNYFMQLSIKQKKNIYHLYEIDFEMFGYSPEPYHPEITTCM